MLVAGDLPLYALEKLAKHYSLRPASRQTLLQFANRRLLLIPLIVDLFDIVLHLCDLFVVGCVLLHVLSHFVLVNTRQLLANPTVELAEEVLSLALGMQAAHYFPELLFELGQRARGRALLGGHPAHGTWLADLVEGGGLAASRFEVLQGGEQDVLGLVHR